MDYKELLREVKNPEKEIVEIKQSFKQWDEIAKTIAAFSTKRGGKIFVGIDKNGCPIGTQCNNEIKGKLQTLANNEIKPSANISVELVVHDSKKESVIGCITVQKGNNVFSYKGVNYERRGDTNHSLTADEIFEIQKSIKKFYFDEMPAFSTDRPCLISDIDETKVHNFLDQFKQTNGKFDVKRFLLNNSLIVNGGIQVKNAAVMLFGKNPGDFIPQLKISSCVFPTEKITSDFLKKEFTGDIFEIFRKSFIEIQRNMRIHSFVDKDKRFDVPEYPLEAIREVLINAVVHRDYSDRNTETFIKMFTDRIEILNPATFPFENLTFEEIEKSGLSKRRNPIIANFFEKVGWMEQEGRGLNMVHGIMKQHGLPQPIFEVGSNTFKVILENSSNNPIAIKKSPYGTIVNFAELNQRQKEFIKYFEDKPKRLLSRKQYMLITDLDVAKTASRDLEDLLNRGILRRTGTGRGTRYFLT